MLFERGLIEFVVLTLLKLLRANRSVVPPIADCFVRIEFFLFVWFQFVHCFQQLFNYCVFLILLSNLCEQSMIGASTVDVDQLPPGPPDI